MEALVDAVASFFDHLAAIGWASLGLAVLCHLGRITARTRAWRNVVAAAYPDADVRWRDVFGAYSAGIGANAILPGRGGDLLRMFALKRRVEGATYPTLGATLVADTTFDAIVGSLLIAWAVSTGVLPALDVLPSLPAIDWLWVFHNPRAGAGVAFVVLVVATLLTLFAAPRIAEFWRRVRQGLAILRQPRRYLRTVASWQALDWCFRLAAIFFFLHAFHLPATALNVATVQVTQSLATLLPLTPGGIGTEQALLVYLFRDAAGAADVLSFSVGVKLVVITINVTLGTIATFAMFKSLRWRAAAERDAAAADAAAEAQGRP